MENNEYFGPHLMLDLSECNVEKLNNYRFIFDLLSELPTKIGMTKITQPYVFPYSGLVPEDAGITGVVIVAESHISMHTFVHKEYVFIDIFSCKPFDLTDVEKYLIDIFESKNYTRHFTQRGLDFPR